MFYHEHIRQTPDVLFRLYGVPTMKTYIEQLNAEVHFTLNDLTFIERQACAEFAANARNNEWGNAWDYDYTDCPEGVMAIINRTYAAAYIDHAKTLYARRWQAAIYCFKQYAYYPDVETDEDEYTYNPYTELDTIMLAVLDADMVHDPLFAKIVCEATNFYTVANNPYVKKLVRYALNMRTRILSNKLERNGVLKNIKAVAPAVSITEEIEAVKSFAYYNYNRLCVYCATCTSNKKFRMNLKALNTVDQSICRETAQISANTFHDNQGYKLVSSVPIYIYAAKKLYWDKVDTVIDYFDPNALDGQIYPMNRDILAPIVVDMVINTPEFMAIEMHQLDDYKKAMDAKAQLDALLTRMRPLVMKRYRRICDQCLYGPAKAKARLEQKKARALARGQNAAKHAAAAAKKSYTKPAILPNPVQKMPSCPHNPTPVSILNMSDEEFDKWAFTPDYDYTPVKEKDLTESGPVTSDFLDWCEMSLTKGCDPKRDRLPVMLNQHLISLIMEEYQAPEEVAQEIVRDAPFDYKKRIRALAYSMQHNKQLFSFMAWCNDEIEEGSEGDKDMQDEILYTLESDLQDYIASIKSLVLNAMNFNRVIASSKGHPFGLLIPMHSGTHK